MNVLVFASCKAVVVFFSLIINAQCLFISGKRFMSPIHCSPEDAVRVHKDIKSKRSVGMHWGTVSNHHPHQQPLHQTRQTDKANVSEPGPLTLTTINHKLIKPTNQPLPSFMFASGSLQTRMSPNLQGVSRQK